MVTERSSIDCGMKRENNTNQLKQSLSSSLSRTSSNYQAQVHLDANHLILAQFRTLSHVHMPRILTFRISSSYERAGAGKFPESLPVSRI